MLLYISVGHGGGRKEWHTSAADTWQVEAYLRAIVECRIFPETREDKRTIGRDMPTLSPAPVKLLFSSRYHAGRREGEPWRRDHSSWEVKLHLAR